MKHLQKFYDHFAVSIWKAQIMAYKTHLNKTSTILLISLSIFLHAPSEF